MDDLGGIPFLGNLYIFELCYARKKKARRTIRSSTMASSMIVPWGVPAKVDHAWDAAMQAEKRSSGVLLSPMTYQKWVQKHPQMWMNVVIS